MVLSMIHCPNYFIVRHLDNSLDCARATISATVDDVDEEEEYDLQDFAEEVKLRAQEIVVLYELSSLPRSEGIALTINANHNWGRFEYTGKEDVYELLDCVRKVIDQLEYDARNYSHY